MTDIGKKCKKNRRNQCKIEGKKTDERDKIGKTIGKEYRKKRGELDGYKTHHLNNINVEKGPV